MVKGQGHSGSKSLFFFIIPYQLPYYISQLLYVWSIWNLVCRFDMPFADLSKNFMKIKWVMGNDVMVTPFKFSPYNCPYFKFYWTYKLHFWYKHSTTFNTLKKCKWSWQMLKVTGEGQRSHKINKWWYLIKHQTNGTKVQ